MLERDGHPQVLLNANRNSCMAHHTVIADNLSFSDL